MKVYHQGKHCKNAAQFTVDLEKENMAEYELFACHGRLNCAGET